MGGEGVSSRLLGEGLLSNRDLSLTGGGRARSLPYPAAGGDLSRIAAWRLRALDLPCLGGGVASVTNYLHIPTNQLQRQSNVN